MNVVGINQNGNIVWHAAGVYQDYHSLCGMDASDPVIGHHGIVEAKRGQKITCTLCYRIWRNTVALKLRESSFTVPSQ